MASHEAKSLVAALPPLVPAKGDANKILNDRLPYSARNRSVRIEEEEHFPCLPQLACVPGYEKFLEGYFYRSSKKRCAVTLQDSKASIAQIALTAAHSRPFAVKRLSVHQSLTDGVMCLGSSRHRLKGRRPSGHHASVEHNQPSQITIKASKAQTLKSKSRLENVERLQREACESLRMLVFGCVGNEDLPGHQKATIFLQRRGNFHEVQAFVDTWLLLDEDEDGSVDFEEFLEFFRRRKVDKLSGMRCIRFLVSMEQEAKVSVRKEDMMRVIWLKAEQEDIDHMSAVFQYYVLQKMQMPTPPILSKKRRRELVENFKALDKSNEGTIPYTDLVDAGLVDQDSMLQMRQEHDINSDGMIDVKEFLTIFCPYGMRAHEGVLQTVDKNGQAMSLVYCQCGDHEFHGWLLDSQLEAAKNRCPQNELLYGDALEEHTARTRAQKTFPARHSLERRSILLE